MLVLCCQCRSLFIIDDKGRLRQITINDFPVGRSVDETLRLVQAFQFTDTHGEGLSLLSMNCAIYVIYLNEQKIIKFVVYFISCYMLLFYTCGAVVSLNVPYLCTWTCAPHYMS